MIATGRVLASRNAAAAHARYKVRTAIASPGWTCSKTYDASPIALAMVPRLKTTCNGFGRLRVFTRHCTRVETEAITTASEKLSSVMAIRRNGRLTDIVPFTLSSDTFRVA